MTGWYSPLLPPLKSILCETCIAIRTVVLDRVTTLALHTGSVRFVDQRDQSLDRASDILRMVSGRLSLLRLHPENLELIVDRRQSGQSVVLRGWARSNAPVVGTRARRADG